MTRTNTNPLLPHEVQFVVSEITEIPDIAPYQLRCFINERIIVHCLKSDTRGYYALTDPSLLNKAELMDVSDLLFACERQVRAAVKESISDLVNRLHGAADNCETIYDYYSNQDYMKIYADDGSCENIRLRMGCDGLDGPTLDLVLDIDGITKLQSQLNKVKQAIIINIEKLRD